MPKTKGLSSVQRTLKALRDRGMVCAIVEKFNTYAGPWGRREDLFGIIDIIALDPEKGVVGIQACGSNFSGHLTKIMEEKSQETIDWLNTPGTSLELWGWRKILKHRGGKMRIWTPRVKEITLNDFKL